MAWKRRPRDPSAMPYSYEEEVRERVREETEGLDLVSLALDNPLDVTNNVTRRCVLLGRTPSLVKEKTMVRNIMNKESRSIGPFVGKGAYPGTYGTFFSTIDCWKLIFCDARFVEDSAHLEREYQAQFLAEEQQTPLERAREAVRTDEEKLARRNAKLMIAALEELTPEELGRLDEKESRKIWGRIAPGAPSWITNINRNQLPWGYVFYKTTQVNELFGDEWYEAKDRFEELDNVVFGIDKSIAMSAGLGSIHSPCDDFINYWREDLVDQTFDDEDLDGPRNNFREYRTTLDANDGILKNTFIVLNSDCVHPNLLTCDELMELLADDEEYLVYWLWACDANWELCPPGQDADEGGYQGRVKVPFACLQAWFYAARCEGVDVKAMWKKAQLHPRKLWVCNTKAMQNWEHESYV
ncbi:hypothetical protein F5X68DRAFT_258159 [Plectosphaerella plurivora]|uniref:Uncharacterized protein n=1 Tax=Plectosphaerella plurivora TaxID=936078 RepID=A0A9P9AFS3_9PEZI|nr:hypothetical protein F5X68DRAFT_258159 [Plectosphaerella plurivora]